jgi:GxxExxY protein
MSTDKPFAREGYDLMAAAFEVHHELGGGLAEEIYQESLEIELELRAIPFDSKRQLQVFYKARELQHRYIPDLFVYGSIVVELKAVSALLSEHEAQLLNYMRLTRSPVGYLINFGPISKVEWKRFVLSEFVDR